MSNFRASTIAQIDVWIRNAIAARDDVADPIEYETVTKVIDRLLDDRNEMAEP